MRLKSNEDKISISWKWDLNPMKKWFLLNENEILFNKNKKIY